MITVALSATIGATRGRVWQALTVLGERTSWDERILGEITLDPVSHRSDRTGSSQAAPHSAPIQRTSVRWRYRLGGVQLVMREDVREVEPPRRIVSRISIGSLRFDQTFSLYREDDESGARTRLGLKVTASNSIAVVDEIVPRLDVQKLMIEFADTTLRQVRKHCEADA